MYELLALLTVVIVVRSESSLREEQNGTDQVDDEVEGGKAVTEQKAKQAGGDDDGEPHHNTLVQSWRYFSLRLVLYFFLSLPGRGIEHPLLPSQSGCPSWGQSSQIWPQKAWRTPESESTEGRSC